MKKQPFLNLLCCHLTDNESVSYESDSQPAAGTGITEFHTSCAASPAPSDSAGVTQHPPEKRLTEPFTCLPIDDTCPLVLPKVVQKDFLFLVKAVKRQKTAHRFLFLGPSGTGKTAAAQMLGKHTERTVYTIDLANTLGNSTRATADNIKHTFADIPLEGLIVVDGLAALNTHGKSSHPAATFRQILARLPAMTTMVVTANLSAETLEDWAPFFDAIVDFDRYTEADRLKAADAVLAHLRNSFRYPGNPHLRLFHRLLRLQGPVPAPGTVKTRIQSALILSDPDKPADYLRRFFEAITKTQPLSLQNLRDKDFSVREIEVLTGTPKSTVARLTQAPALSDSIHPAKDVPKSMQETASPILHYKGYSGSIEVDLKSDNLYGKVLNIRGSVVYKANTVSELRQNFKIAVDDYLMNHKINE